MKPLACLVVLAAVLATDPALAQITSRWASMAVAGDLNNWSADPNMSLVSNNTWQADLLIITSVRTRFKFVAERNWEVSEWGITNQTDFTFDGDEMVHDYADFFTNSASYGKDIVISNVTSGIYRFIFDDSIGEFTVTLVQPVAANYSLMSVAGDVTSWQLSPNMTLISNYTWQGEFFIGASSRSAFKFVAQNDWNQDFGEQNQTDYTVPMSGTAEYKPGYGFDIVMYNLAAGLYRFKFNDSNYNYSVEFVRPGVANYNSMAVAGTFNSWSPIPNMTLLTDHVWQGTFDFVNSGTINFKFAANASWNTAWGISNQVLTGIPIMGTADVINVSGYDFQIIGGLNGRYHFRFNDQTRAYEVVPDGIVETFNEWPRRSSYSNWTNANWVIYGGMCHTSNARYGLCIRLDYSSPSTGQYVRTPLFINGVKEFSFWYRSWSDSPAIDMEIQQSYDATNWTIIDTIDNITTPEYTRYSKSLEETNACYLRLLHTAGGERFLLEDFIVIEPFADVSIADVVTSPARPWSNDSIRVFATVLTNRFATNLYVSLRYRTGTNGPFSSIAMTGITNRYTNMTDIVPQPSGSLLQYYIQADFLGRGNRSPVFWPYQGSNNPAWLGIPRNKPGTIWINEVSYEPYTFIDTNTWDFWITTNDYEFIEICGKAGSDIGGWSVELLSVYVPYASYAIPNNRLLPNDTNGFGFFVLGDSNVVNVDVVFTNSISGHDSLLKRGAIGLKNEFGQLEFLMSYGDPMPTNIPGSLYMGMDDYFYFTDLSVALSGSGSNYYSFTWGTNDMITPGALSSNQTLTGGYEDPLPDLDEADFFAGSLGSQMTFYLDGTNGWNAVPYYTTSLTNEWPAGWTPISPYESWYANGVSTVRFSYPEGVTGAYFRVMTQRSW